MANILGKRTQSRDHVVEEFTPPGAWTEDSHNHYLLVDLPDFRKEEVRLQVDEKGQITVSGERLVNNNKYIYFEKTFEAPKNSDIDNITGRFESEILYVTLPKKATTNTNVQQNPSSNTHDDDEKKEKEEEETKKEEMSEESKRGTSVDGFNKEIIEKWERGDNECSVLDRAMEMVKTNRNILITAVLAFSIGMLVSRQFGSAQD